MLEMSNGYPNSSSPLGGSPSPGPSPVLTNKALQHAKQHSPGPGRTNLRVVIPTPQGHNIGPTEEVSMHTTRIGQKYFVLAKISRRTYLNFLD